MDYRVDIARFPFKKPFVISGYTFRESETIRVRVNDGPHCGRGEAIGVHYLGETVDSMAAQVEHYFSTSPDPFSLERLQQDLPAGGARNAIDCALWDLKCKTVGMRIWQMMDQVPKPLTTVFTIGLDRPEGMGAQAEALRGAKTVKLKLGADDPAACVAAVRAVLPDATLIVDVNQGWTFDMLKDYAPALAKLNVAMIEQPLPRGSDAALAEYDAPVPLAADESCQDSAELDSLEGYQIINIKLDKTGGLTEALRLAKRANDKGCDLMVGNMAGSSLSMAPGFVVGQNCRYVDLDGPWLISEDVDDGITYSDTGEMQPPSAALWG